MAEISVQLLIFTALPILLGLAIVGFDRTATTPVRRAEAFLVPLLLLGVGGSGLSAFIAKVFIGWSPDTPYVLESGFAGLAAGLLGAIAAERRDGFREATALAVTALALGAALAQVMGGLAAGAQLAHAALAALSELVRPAAFIWFLLALRRAERSEPPTIILRSWLIPVRRASVVAVGIAATAYSVGASTGQVVVVPLAGTLAAALAFWLIVSRAPSHRTTPVGQGE
jgi:hypothetical protein